MGVYSYSQARGKVPKAVKKYVKNVLDANEEDKIFLTNQLNASGVNGDVESTNGSFQNLTGMAQGTTNITRLGNVIKPKSLEIWVQARHAQVGVAGDTIVRCIIFMDHDQEGTQPLSTGVITNASVGTSNYVIAPYNQDNVPSRFTIMLDKRLKLDLNGDNLAHFYHKFSKRDLRTIQFVSNAGIIGRGTVRSLLLSTQADGDADIPEVGITSRLVYEDA